MRFFNKFILILLLLIQLISLPVYAGGISVDAGLTPGQDRWIFRTQYRSMNMHNSDMTVQNNIVPIMLAYGATSDFTLMARGVFVHRTLEMNDKEQQSGINDPFFLLKMKMYRHNTEKFVIGLAPYLASNIPVGNTEISNRTWNPELGISMSFRPRFWSVDLTLSYEANDILSKTMIQEKDVITTNLAISSIVPIANSTVALSPVMEFSYRNELNNSSNPENRLLFLSPGLIFIKSSTMIEALFQYPILQTTDARIMKAESRIILGLRYMF